MYIIDATICVSVRVAPEALTVEFLTRCGIVLQDLCRLKLWTVLICIALHAIHERLCAPEDWGVQHSEGASEVRGETHAKNCTDISISWGSHNLILQAVSSLVDEFSYQAPLDVFHADSR